MCVEMVDGEEVMRADPAINQHSKQAKQIKAEIKGNMLFDDDRARISLFSLTFCLVTHRSKAFKSTCFHRLMGTGFCSEET